MGDEDRPEIIECAIRLHSARPVKEGAGELSWSDWSGTVVGEPVTFQAIAITGKGTWNGPLAPGVEISPPVPLDDPWWSVFLPDGRGVPVVVGRVGHPLAVGEAFTLPPGEAGVWAEGVVFDGAIVIE
jgi:hypothetical protein